MRVLDRDKIILFTINFITWFIPWVMLSFPDMNNLCRYYCYSYGEGMCGYEELTHMFFGMFIAPFCLLSFLLSYRFITRNSVMRYFEEYGSKIKEPITVIASFALIIYIINQMIMIMTGAYLNFEGMFNGILYPFISLLLTQAIILVATGMLISVFFMQIYKLFQNK
ncbi:MAG: hypothetical protein C4617_04305 [Candidatus Liberibacter europaeus]|uniref:Uncharacterized protein n=1 Tax=Candidatus Liberibacter europaeus TaxID=744859 RepID=A0A2T4VXC7_9HYPH|nr:MAG: hypothetical protein C4617_04305 [Candidatus Liberibacter europaeus]